METRCLEFFVMYLKTKPFGIVDMTPVYIVKSNYPLGMKGEKRNEEDSSISYDSDYVS